MSDSSPSKIRVIAFTRYDDAGASSRARFLEYVPFLESSGIAVTAHPLFGNRYLERLYQHRSRSLLEVGASLLRRLIQSSTSRSAPFWIEKELLPFVPASVERLLWGSRRVIIDFDDAIECRYEKSPHILRRKFEQLLPRAALVTAGSDALVEWARARGATKVVKVPSAVDTSRLYPVPAHHRGPLRIGWIGSPETVHFLKLIEPALLSLASQVDFELHVVGAAITIPGIKIRHLEWSLAAEQDHLTTFDLGIMPLGSTDWCRSKCAYKLVQYGAAGLPAVASAVGENMKVVIHGETGLLAKSQQEWLDALVQLASDSELRRGMGAAARRHIEKTHSHSVVGPYIASQIRQVVE